MKNLSIKDQKNLLDKTVKVSLVLQVIAGIITIYGLFIKVKKEDIILNNILVIDVIVQCVEFIFYVYLAMNLYTLDNNIIASQRYIDWVITTPIMLYSTVLYMEYENASKLQPNKIVTIEKVNKKYGKDIMFILLFNFAMLIFGLLGETNIINKTIAIPLGFVFFGLSFNKIWEVFAKITETSRVLFYVLIFIWALYGFAAIFSVLPKNIMYNCLDIVSKNFYGLFIFYLIWAKNN